MVRVLFLADSTGVGAAPSALARLLRRLDRSRWEPTVVSLDPPGPAAARIRALGVEVVHAGLGDETGGLALIETVLAARALPRLLGGRRFGIVHSAGPRARRLGARAAPRLGARAHVSEVREAPGSARASLLERRAARRVSLFVVPWAGGATALRRRLGLPAGRCSVVPDGIDLAEADAGLAVDREPVRRGLGLFPGDVAMVFLGGLREQAGLVHLLGAFHALLQAQPTARLLIAGDGPARRALEAGVAALRLSPFVRFLGALPSPWPLFAAADVFALPAVAGGAPLALLEAMAARLPAVATAVGAVPEIVVDDREALLVPPADPAALARALADLAADPGRRRELGARARLRVERAFCAEDTARAWERLYDALLEGAVARS